MTSLASARAWLGRRLHDLFSAYALGLTDWDKLYRTWKLEDFYYEVEGLDPDVSAALKRHGPRPGARVLDVGTGLGTAARELARLGFSVVAVDASAEGLSRARRRAGPEGREIRFVRADITQPGPELGGPFDAAFDRGCFHGLLPALRGAYVSQLSRLTRKGGILYLKTCSREEWKLPGPFRFSPEEITEAFGGTFELLEARVSPLPVSRGRAPLYLLSVLKRRGRC